MLIVLILLAFLSFYDTNITGKQVSNTGTLIVEIDNSVGDGLSEITSYPEGLYCGGSEIICTASFPVGTYVTLEGNSYSFYWTDLQVNDPSAADCSQYIYGTYCQILIESGTQKVRAVFETSGGTIGFEGSAGESEG